MKLSIVIAVFNERAFVIEILNRIQKVNLDGIEKEIVVIDDCSTDGTRELLEKIKRAQMDSYLKKLNIADANRELDITNIKIIFQEKNMGKGAALRRGFKEATGEIVVVQDADLEYDPNDYSVPLRPFEKGVADVVYGSRFLGGEHRVLYYWHFVGNRFLITLSNMFTDLNLSDMETCYKMFRRDIINEIELKESRFGFEPEVTAKISQKGCRIYEVSISYYGRSYAQGKKIGWKDGLKAIYYIIRYSIF